MPVIITTRSKEMQRVDDVLTIANITVPEELRGKGFFTEMVRHVRESYPKKTVYVENTLDMRFADYLRRTGFEEVVNPYNGVSLDPPCWVKWPER